MADQTRKIKYIDNGKTYSIKSCGIVYSGREISKEEYDRLKELSAGELNAIVESNLSDTIRWGYGYYGSKVLEDNGTYYLEMKIGSSCD